MYLIKNAKIYAPEYLGISDADLVLAEEATLELLSVFAKGVLMIHEKEVFVKGTFE